MEYESKKVITVGWKEPILVEDITDPLRMNIVMSADPENRVPLEYVLDIVKETRPELIVLDADVFHAMAIRMPTRKPTTPETA